jgi:hypothetical protein
MANEIKSFNKRLEALRSERSSFIPIYRELSDYHLAHRGRFLTSDRNKGYKRNTKQYNNTSRLAARTLASGMMSGITSPARPWFRLGIGDLDLREYAPVKQWLHQVQSLMYRVYSASNFYNSMHMLYSELGVFGTGSMGIYSDFENVIHCRPYTTGSYMLAMNGLNQVDTQYREYEISVGQCVKEFGIENCSKHVKRQWEEGNTEAWVQLVHVIEPNDDRDMMSPFSKDKPFRSVYYEVGSNSQLENKFLRESGFDEFPIIAPRWDITGEDVYGVDCPGMTALGDTKALQLGEKRQYQAVDKLNDPPLQGPAALINKIGNAVRAGDKIATTGSGDKLDSIYGNYRPDLNAIKMINNDAEDRVRRAMYEDLFLMLANTDRRQITAREIAEKHEEKLLMLGPVLERMHTEGLDPTIDITFNKLQQAGVLPDPPEELVDQDLNVEYVSILAQAQRLVSTGSLDRLGNYIAQISTVWPEARHKFNAVQSVDEYAEALGTSPSVIRSDDEVEAIKQAEVTAQQNQAAQVQGQVMADVAKTASETEISEDNALGNVMKRAGLA